MSSMVLVLWEHLLRSRSLSSIVRSLGAVFVAMMSRCRSSGGGVVCERRPASNFPSFSLSGKNPASVHYLKLHEYYLFLRCAIKVKISLFRNFLFPRNPESDALTWCSALFSSIGMSGFSQTSVPHSTFPSFWSALLSVNCNIHVTCAHSVF